MIARIQSIPRESEIYTEVHDFPPAGSGRHSYKRDHICLGDGRTACGGRECVFRELCVSVEPWKPLYCLLGSALQLSPPQGPPRQHPQPPPQMPDPRYIQATLEGGVISLTSAEQNGEVAAGDAVSHTLNT